MEGWWRGLWETASSRVWRTRSPRCAGKWGDVLVGVLIGVACGITINAVLIAMGLAWPLLRRHEWMRTIWIALVALATIALQYWPYGLLALKRIFGGLKPATLPSPWRVLELVSAGLGGPAAEHTVATFLGYLLPIAMIIVAWFVCQQISSDQPGEVMAPLALSYAWILVARGRSPGVPASPWSRSPRCRATG
jgi:hypothetical protein